MPGRGRGVSGLLNVPGDELGHLEHADLLFAVKHGLQSVVGIDLGFLLRILQSVFANVNPKLFGQFGTRQRLFADHFRQLIIWLNRLHERCVWCPFGFLSRRHAPLMLNSERKDNQNLMIFTGKCTCNKTVRSGRRVSSARHVTADSQDGRFSVVP